MGGQVVGQLLRELPSTAEIIILAGERYREDVIPALQAAGYKVSIPLKGLRFGNQLQRLNELNATQSPSRHDDRFYDLVNRPRLTARSRAPATGVQWSVGVASSWSLLLPRAQRIPSVPAAGNADCPSGDPCREHRVAIQSLGPLQSASRARPWTRQPSRVDFPAPPRPRHSQS